MHQNDADAAQTTADAQLLKERRARALGVVRAFLRSRFVNRVQRAFLIWKMAVDQEGDSPDRLRRQQLQNDELVAQLSEAQERERRCCDIISWLLDMDNIRDHESERLLAELRRQFKVSLQRHSPQHLLM